MTNRGLCIELSLIREINEGGHIAFLECKDSKDHSTVGICLAVMPDGRYSRTDLDQLPRKEWPRYTRYKATSAPTTLYIPQEYCSQDELKWGYQFRVKKGASKDLEKHHVYFKDVLPSFASSMLGSLMPWYKSSPLGFYLASTTLSGRRESNDTLEFSLKPGGMAGLLFGPVTSWDASTLSSPIRLPFVAVVFGLNRDEVFYCDILDMSKFYKGNHTGKWGYKDVDLKTLDNDEGGILQATATATPSPSRIAALGEKFEEYLLSYSPSSFKTRQKKNICGLDFKVEVRKRASIGNTEDFLVAISYSPDPVQIVQAAFLSTRVFPPHTGRWITKTLEAVSGITSSEPRETP
jgi:hypothetical protein